MMSPKGYKRVDYSKCSREELIERILNLESVLGLDFTTHPSYNLTNLEDKILGQLILHTVATRRMFYEAIYGMDSDPPYEKIVDVFVCKLRKKLKPHGVEIKTMWGQGYFLEPDMRERAKTFDINWVVEPRSDGALIMGEALARKRGLDPVALVTSKGPSVP